MNVSFVILLAIRWYHKLSYHKNESFKQNSLFLITWCVSFLRLSDDDNADKDFTNHNKLIKTNFI